MRTCCRPRRTHVALPVADLDASLAWYERYTPLQTIDRRADDLGQSAWLSHPEPTDRPFVLVLVAFDDAKGVPQPQLAPFAHLGMELPSKADVDAMAERARADQCLTWEPVQLVRPGPLGHGVHVGHRRQLHAEVAKVQLRLRHALGVVEATRMNEGPIGEARMAEPSDWPRSSARRSIVCSGVYRSYQASDVEVGDRKGDVGPRGADGHECILELGGAARRRRDVSSRGGRRDGMAPCHGVHDQLGARRSWTSGAGSRACEPIPPATATGGTVP